MSPFWELGLPLVISLRSPGVFFFPSFSFVGSPMFGFALSHSAFRSLCILAHFKAGGDGAGREDEAVPVAGALVKPCAWRKLAEVPAVTAVPLLRWASSYGTASEPHGQKIIPRRWGLLSPSSPLQSTGQERCAQLRQSYGVPAGISIGV